ncbi:MAG: fatty acid oxidation complex subunit alpha FadB [Holophaga sp.]|nr:fatty acid oxidation complex subunit alpha FadB [Holophaga sp.]
MRFEGKCMQCFLLEDGVAELRLDLQAESVNKFNRATLAELAEAVALLQAEPGVRGLLLTSAKDCFVVGADVTEFLDYFQDPEEQLAQWLLGVDRLLSAIEDFDFPTVAAINGFAFGGGLEFALAASYRVMAEGTRVGVPETKLGIYPGWGGTVRLSRLAGADNAIEWIAGGEQFGAAAALKVGVVDAVVAPDQLRAAALDLLGQAMAGRRDWRARRLEKVSPLQLSAAEAMMVFEGAKAFVAAKAGPNYPAPVAAIEAMQRGAGLGRDAALAIEAAGFARMAKTATAFNLVGIFLGDHAVARKARAAAKAGAPVRAAAVLGAGIMGGGIAFQSALKGTPIVMKDIQEQALALGLAEADKLLVKRVERGKLTPAGMAAVLNRIRPTLGYGDCRDIDLAVEAVVENERVKRSVLVELEAQVRPDTILASNTSTISISRLAEALQRPENFCGMHFFNPVHRMPLVEVIRGRRSSERAVATTVGYALAMGKTPIVVNDCPGFLVNRILFPYFAGFQALVRDGVHFHRIDQVMERFGWPMGPAYLLDVVGIDTARHAGAVMAAAYPDRMAQDESTAIELMFQAQRFGQKNGKGFYAYLPDPKGVPRKEPDPEADAVLRTLHPQAVPGPGGEVTDQDIVDRMMLPMVIECSRCLEDGIVDSPVEVDLGLVYGLGFPPFRGGPLRFADAVGLKALCQAAERHSALGELYRPTAQMLQLAQTGSTFHQEK